MQQELRYRLLARAQSKKLDFENLAAIAEKSAPMVCRYRLPYDITALDYDEAMTKAPTWKAYLDRTSDALSICQFIYEVCTAQGSYKQSLWLHGDPDAGKSTLAIVLKEIFKHGNACVILNPTTELSHGHTRFLVAKMHGSALVCWDDSPANLASNGEFKGITGNRLQSLEEKGRRAVQVSLSCRHMITSNPPPEYRLDDEKETIAMATRFVEVEITAGERPKDWDAWKTALKKEFQWLLAAGKRAFLDKHIESKCQSRIDSQVTKSYGRDDMNDFLTDFAYCKGSNLQTKNLRNYLSNRDYKKDTDINKFKQILIRYFKTREIRRDNVRYIENVRKL
jgi:phage/plasmid-associated DNA primase